MTTERLHPADRRLLEQNRAGVTAEECGHRDDPGHDHEQCLEIAARNRARVTANHKEPNA